MTAIICIGDNQLNMVKTTKNGPSNTGVLFLELFFL